MALGREAVYNLNGMGLAKQTLCCRHEAVMACYLETECNGHLNIISILPQLPPLFLIMCNSQLHLTLVLSYWLYYPVALHVFNILCSDY